MSYRVDTTPNFEREAKRLIKKYKSLKNEINTLIESLEEMPEQGTHLGNDIYLKQQLCNYNIYWTIQGRQQQLLSL